MVLNHIRRKILFNFICTWDVRFLGVLYLMVEVKVNVLSLFVHLKTANGCRGRDPFYYINNQFFFSRKLSVNLKVVF
jgi:hypothetical protein